MSMWGEVVGSVRAMGAWQLLFAFVACTGHALAHGRLVGARARATALVLTVLGLLGFVLETERWVDGVVLVAVGVAALGVFAAAVWLVCGVLGLAHHDTTAASPDSLPSVSPAEPGSLSARPLPGPQRAAASH